MLLITTAWFHSNTFVFSLRVAKQVMLFWVSSLLWKMDSGSAVPCQWLKSFSELVYNMCFSLYAVCNHWCGAMWLTYSHRAGLPGGQSGAAREEGCLLSEQCAAPLALHHPGPQGPRGQEVLWKVLCWCYRSYQWVLSCYCFLTLPIWFICLDKEFDVLKWCIFGFCRSIFSILLCTVIKVFVSFSWFCSKWLSCWALRSMSTWNSRVSLSPQKIKKLKVSES